MFNREPTESRFRLFLRSLRLNRFSIASVAIAFVLLLNAPTANATVIGSRSLPAGDILFLLFLLAAVIGVLLLAFLGILRPLLGALWLTRFSVASVVIALVLFLNAPPANDMFLEVRPDPTEGRRFWVEFFLLVAFIWMLPVYCGARLALSAQHERVAGLKWAERALPYVLMVLCLLAILVGIVSARSHLGTVDIALIKDTKQHLDILWYVGSAFFVGLVVLMIWAAGRREVTAETVPSFSDTTSSFWRLFPEVRARSQAEKLPLALCAWVLIIFSLLTLLLYVFPPETLAAAFPRAQMIPILFGFWVAPLTWLGLWSIEKKWPYVLLFILAFGFVADGIRDRHVLRTVAITQWEKVGGSDRTSEADPSFEADRVACFPSEPNLALKRKPADVCPSSLSKSSLSDPNGPTKPAQCARLQFAEAVKIWKSKNNCLADKDGEIHCPRPIIVAGAGGASRAAFFTGTVLGFIKDIAENYPDNKDGKEFRSLDDQLFALSSVSGSSLATAYYVALQKDAVIGSDNHRITAEKVNEDGLWFDTPTKAERIFSWKDRMQILLAGDFLTAPVASGAFRDLSPVGAFYNINDRARIQEEVWENRFTDIVGVDASNNPVAQPLSQLRPTTDDWLPLLYFNGSSVATGRRIIAAPVDPELPHYKRNIECKQYDPYYEFYNDAYDFHDLINGRTAAHQERSTDEERLLKRDINLSTAILLTARFPFVSPHATIRNAKGDDIDWLVDGGYFENYAATTADEIVDAIHIVEIAGDPTTGRDEDKKCDCNPLEKGVSCRAAHDSCRLVEKSLQATTSVCDNQFVQCVKKHGDHGLKEVRSQPLIVQISNEPGVKGCQPDKALFDPAARPELVTVNRKWFLSEPRSIASAILSARIARGTHASEFSSHNRDDHDEGYFAAYDRADPGYTHYRVCGESIDSPDRKQVRNELEKKGVKEEDLKKAEVELEEAKVTSLKEVSMSWWLSKPVQSYLDKQVCAPHNLQSTVDVLLALSKKTLAADDDVRCAKRIEYSKWVWKNACKQPDDKLPKHQPCGRRQTTGTKPQ